MLAIIHEQSRPRETPPFVAKAGASGQAQRRSDSAASLARADSRNDISGPRLGLPPPSDTVHKPSGEGKLMRSYSLESALGAKRHAPPGTITWSYGHTFTHAERRSMAIAALRPHGKPVDPNPNWGLEGYLSDDESKPVNISSLQQSVPPDAQHLHAIASMPVFKTLAKPQAPALAIDFGLASLLSPRAAYATLQAVANYLREHLLGR